MIVFAGNAQKAAGDVVVFNGFLLPLAVRAENHFMAVVMMGEYGMHQHHDTGESDGGTCDLTVHHRVAKEIKEIAERFPGKFSDSF